MLPSTISILTGDFVAGGGMDAANLALARYLAQAGCAVHVIGYRFAPELRTSPGVTVHRVPRPGKKVLLGMPLLDLAGRWWSRRLGPASLSIVNGGNCPDGEINWVHYVHSAYTPQTGMNGWRTVLTGLRHRLYLWQERHAIPRARLVIADSERTRRDVIEHLGVPPERVKTVYYGCDPDQLQIPEPSLRAAQRRRLGLQPEQVTAIFVGALTDRRKGFDTVFEAWRQLRRTDGWNGVLLVVGRGVELPLWKQRAEAAGMADSIRFLGYRGDVPDLLAASDILLSPTRYEAYGLAVQEAICRGVPALVSRSAGIAERYPAELSDLLLDDPDSAEELGARLLQWWNCRHAYAAPLAAFAERLRARSWDDMAREMVELAAVLLESAGSRPAALPGQVRSENGYRRG